MVRGVLLVEAWLGSGELRPYASVADCEGSATLCGLWSETNSMPLKVIKVADEWQVAGDKTPVGVTLVLNNGACLEMWSLLWEARIASDWDSVFDNSDCFGM